MKKRNKFLALLLAMALCASTLVACQNSTQTTTEAPEKGTQGTEAPGTDAPTDAPTEAPTEAEPVKNVDIYPLSSDKTFNVISGQSVFKDTNSTLITQSMEKATGVKVNWGYMDSKAFSLALTGEDYPEATFLYAGDLSKADVYEYGKANYFVNFMDYLDLMPNFKAVIEANPEVLDVVQNEDGSVYCLPQLLTTSTGTNNMIYYRTDMAKAAGWDKAPATTDEFIQFVKDLQKHYGAIDPEFIAFNGYQANYMEWSIARFPNYFFSAFGELVLTGLTVDSKDKVVFGATTDQFKYYLEFMNELWNSGGFNTNIYSQEGAASKALNAGNHCAISPVTTGFTMSNFTSGNFDLEVMEPLTSEHWNTKHWYQAPACKWGRLTLLSTKCQDIETMVKWYDAWYSTAENPLNADGSVYGITPWLGEVGVDYIFDDATGIYTEQAHDGIDAGKFASSQGFATVLYSGFENGFFPYAQEPTTGTGVKGQGTIKNLWPYGVTPKEITSLALTEDENDIYNDAWTDINNFVNESTAKFITGEWSIAEKWDSYLAELDKMGLDDVIGVYEAAYARYKAK